MIYQDCSSLDFETDGYEKAARLLHAHSQGMAKSEQYTVIFPSRQELAVQVQPESSREDVEKLLRDSVDTARRERGFEVGTPELPEPKKSKKK